MKKGVILYIAGTGSEKIYDNPKDVDSLGLKADRVEIVDSRSCYSDIHPAAWRLLAGGMHQILCISAKYSGADGLKCVGQQMRIYG